MLTSPPQIPPEFPSARTATPSRTAPISGKRPRPSPSIPSRARLPTGPTNARPHHPVGHGDDGAQDPADERLQSSHSRDHQRYGDEGPDANHLRHVDGD